jgi:hypothetical protein
MSTHISNTPEQRNLIRKYRDSIKIEDEFFNDPVSLVNELYLSYFLFLIYIISSHRPRIQLFLADQFQNP